MQYKKFKIYKTTEMYAHNIQQNIMHLNATQFSFVGDPNKLFLFVVLLRDGATYHRGESKEVWQYAKDWYGTNVVLSSKLDFLLVARRSVREEFKLMKSALGKLWDECYAHFDCFLK